MSTSPSRFLTPLLLAALFPAAAASQTNGTIPGWRYTVNITYDSGDATHRASIAMRHVVGDNILRTEIVQAGGTASPVGANIEGFYTIVNPADSTYTTVMPSHHAATVMANPMSMVKGIAMPKFEIHETQHDLVDLGAGERILGHATRHYRLTTAGTLDIIRGGEVCTHTLDGESEMWIAPDLDPKAMMIAQAKTYGLDTDSLLRGAASGADASKLAKGLALRTRQRTVTTDSAGVTHAVTTTIEYVELAQGPLEASLFKVPDGYNVMDMRKMPPIPQAVMDSVLRSQTRKTGCY